jgi:site-specific recombinase XerD
MTTVTRQRRSPLGLFPDKPAPRLYDRIVEVLRVRHYSRRTEEAYVHWIGRYIAFHQYRHPRQLAEGDVNRFLTNLAVKEFVAASTQNQALSAILFLYEHVLEQPLDRIEGVVRARRPKRLPVVLTVDEVSRVMAHLTGDKRPWSGWRRKGGRTLFLLHAPLEKGPATFFSQRISTTT